MVYENIQFATHNLAIDRSGAAFYTVDHTTNQLIKKNSSGTIIFSYFLAENIEEVWSLQFDGYYFWTLERFSTAGFRVRRWQIGSDDLVRPTATFSVATDVFNQYDVRTMAVEHYSDTLAAAGYIGGATLEVTDGEVVRVGDRLVVGPSTVPSYEGLYSFVTVEGKADTTLNVAPPLDNAFNPGDAIYFTRNFFVFSDTAPAGLSGALYKFSADTGALLTLNMSNLFNKVRAATFFGGFLLFIRGGDVIWLDPVSQDIYKTQAIDNLDTTRAGFIETYALAGYSNNLYRLEQQRVYYDVGFDMFMSEDWSPQYNYTTSTTVPTVYFVALKAEPPVLHHAVESLAPESVITVEVLDQFRTPVQSRTVDFSSTGGSLSSIQETTDANGRATTIYTANNTVGAITITADVT